LSQRTRIEDIHAHPGRGVFMITGGGTQVVSSLLMVPGGSNTILQALVPYSEAALQQHLGFTPASACSEQTARWMAMRGYQMASAERNEPENDVFGLAITASLASRPAKKGKHRIHIAAQTRSTTYTWSLTLEKGHRSREEEEQLCRNMGLNALCEVLHLEPFEALDLLASETMLSHSEEGGEDLQKLLFSKTRTAQLFNFSQSQTRGPELVFPGAFDPLHDGHLNMFEIANEMTGMDACFEICVHNIEKPRLDFISLAQRCAPFNEKPHNLVLTTASRFVDKARCFPSAIFIVGTDTLERIVDTEFYNDSITERDNAIAEIDRLGCRFLVFGRVQSGEFRQLSNMLIPARLKAICTAVPESAYRMDISSTQLRNSRAD